jgi:hypothetical protein
MLKAIFTSFFPSTHEFGEILPQAKAHNFRHPSPKPF